jgi:hypothetical protein
MQNDLINERFIYFRRDPTPGLRFIRVSRWGGDTIPHAKSLVAREVLGWTLDTSGRCVRLFSVRTDVPDDGCRDWLPCHRYPDTPVDPTSVRIKLPGGPPLEQYSPAAVEAIERAHRQPFADHWAAFHANEAALAKARAEQQLKAEREAAERAALVVATPRPRPKPPTIWQKLWGGR